ncbi:hypothetical protein ElyMa_006494800 [Elysia marginata]|uniref:Peptidase S1 domain-containing protein n=1 Tax=Elysia marginata TaxID=1093978 RepID=A0AAV4I3F9_9GAST|nr:hypothetical protein ElyMa_006494800 [Elysia marginata]
MSSFAASNRPDGVSEITLPEPADAANCPQYACSYEEATMTGQVDFDDCFSAGYGSTKKGSNRYSGQLQQVPVKKPDSAGCCDVMLDSLKTGTDTSLSGTVARKGSPSVCFDAQSPATCSGDFGSPIYCKTTTTDEVVLVGMTTSSPCSPGNPFLSVDLTKGALRA